MDLTREKVGNATSISFEQEESSSVEQNYAPAYNLGNETVVMNKIQAQNILTAVHQQFHQNQGKYIDLLSKVVEYQAVLLEQSENSSVYPRAMQNLEQKTKASSENSAPASVTVSPKATPSSEPATIISENISHPVESTSSANGLSNPTPSTTSISVTQLSNRLLAVVSDKTGYPVDMLDLSMDLEADLGIDSIKQVQIFASMQEEFPNIELDTEMLAELRTLAQVIDYMKDYLSPDQTTPLSNDFQEYGAIERRA